MQNWVFFFFFFFYYFPWKKKQTYKQNQNHSLTTTATTPKKGFEKPAAFQKTKGKKEKEAATSYLTREKAGEDPLSECSSHLLAETLEEVVRFCLKSLVCGSSPHT